MSNEHPETPDAYTEPAQTPEPDRAGEEVGFYPAADHAAQAYAAMFHLDADRQGSDFRERLYYALSEAACARLDAGADLVTFGANSVFVHDVAARFLASSLERPSRALTITADRTHARVFINEDTTAYLTELNTGAVIFTDGDAPEFTEPVPPAVEGEAFAGVCFTIRRGGFPAAFVYAMPAAEPGGFLGWKAVTAATGGIRIGILGADNKTRSSIGDDRGEATRVAEAFADAARAAVVAEVISANPALSLADARAMVTIERTARGTDADDERDISNLIATAQD